ncbi:hypothetical protein Tco_1324336 [Tanacetum coccineum]
MKIGAIIPMFFLPFEEVDIRGGRIRKISSFSDRYSKGQSRNKGQGRGGVKVINMSSFEGNKKRSYEGTKPRITKEIAFPTVPHDLRVTIGEQKRIKIVLIEFAIMKCHSAYNVMLGRTRMRSLGAVGSTIHSMMKFLTATGVATITTRKEALRECKQIEEAQNIWRETQRPGKEHMLSDELLGEILTMEKLLDLLASMKIFLTKSLAISLSSSTCSLLLSINIITLVFKG